VSYKFLNEETRDFRHSCLRDLRYCGLDQKLVLRTH
jgi:hypothetical protein